MVKRYPRLIGLGILVAIAIPATWWGRQRLNQPEPTTSGIAVFPSAQSSTPGNDDSDTSPSELSEADRSAIAAVIEQQIAAFQADDAELAFSFASPGIQDRFQTAEQFMAMVRAQYETVYRPQSVNFEEIGWVRGEPVQAVTVLGPSGEWMVAYYQMEKLSDDTWRIAGCLLTPMQGDTI